jgi:hypothetical protein
VKKKLIKQKIIIISVNLALKSINFGTNDNHGQIFSSKIDEIEKDKQKRWQFWKLSQNRLLNEFQLVCKSDKDYYKPVK